MAGQKLKFQRLEKMLTAFAPPGWLMIPDPPVLLDDPPPRSPAQMVKAFSWLEKAHSLRVPKLEMGSSNWEPKN